MNKHNVKSGDKIICQIESRIWLSVGEIFTVERLVESQITNEQGVLFVDRLGSERVFWNTEDYELLNGVK